MNKNNEHILALKISVVLLLIGFLVVPIFSYFANFCIYNFGLDHFYKKYIIFAGVSIIIYFVSLFLAKKTFFSIKQANEKLKEYNHNLAHELKTPISVIKSDLELLKISKNIDFETINSIQEEIILMQKIIDSLLFLAENNKNVEFEKQDIKQEILYLIENKFKKEKKYFLLNLKQDTNIFVNKNLFEIMLKNLLENALKYGVKKDKIEIILEKNYLIIKNKIKKDFLNIKLKNIFQTFYRADNSRNSSGFGLGMNIIEKITKIHNFKIKVEIIDKIFVVKILFK